VAGVDAGDIDRPLECRVVQCSATVTADVVDLRPVARPRPSSSPPTSRAHFDVELEEVKLVALRVR
jgi:hypothetical protein